MSSGLDIAAGVAGIVGLAGTISKTLFQFFNSITDAPESARAVSLSVSSLTIALGQVQSTVLDYRFVDDTDHRDAKEKILESLASCTTVFHELEQKLVGSCLPQGDAGFVRRKWEQIKWSFTDDYLAALQQRLEAEKSTLNLIVDSFSLKLLYETHRMAGETLDNSRKLERILNDIHVCVSYYSRGMTSPASRSAPQLQSSVFKASSVFGKQDLAKLMQSSDSVLSFALEAPTDDEISATWLTNPTTDVPMISRASTSRLRIGTPKIDTLGLLRSTDQPGTQKIRTRMSDLVLRYLNTSALIALSSPFAPTMGTIQSLSSTFNNIRNGNSVIAQDLVQVQANLVTLEGIMCTWTSPGNKVSPRMYQAFELQIEAVRQAAVTYTSFLDSVVKKPFSFTAQLDRRNTLRDSMEHHLAVAIRQAEMMFQEHTIRSNNEIIQRQDEQHKIQKAMVEELSALRLLREKGSRQSAVRQVEDSELSPHD